MVFYWDGKAHMIEFKQPGERQRRVQKDWERIVKEQGFEYYIIDSFEGFQSLIRTLTDQRSYNGKPKTEIGA